MSRDPLREYIEAERRYRRARWIWAVIAWAIVVGSIVLVCTIIWISLAWLLTL